MAAKVFEMLFYSSINNNNNRLILWLEYILLLLLLSGMCCTRSDHITIITLPEKNKTFFFAWHATMHHLQMYKNNNKDSKMAN